MKKGDIVEYQRSSGSYAARVGTIGICSEDPDYGHDGVVTIISPAWEMDEVGEELVTWARCWKKIGRAKL